MFAISNPVNETQRQFQKLCELGGGRKGGPARTKVQELLHYAAKDLNAYAHDQITRYLAEYSDRNPWYVCFAMGLCWGHLARPDDTFMEAAVNLLDDWNDEDLKTARVYHWERGPTPIEQSLRGGYLLFRKVVLPSKLPDDLVQYRRAQERWLSPIIARDRPRYIGSWNATAMFMIALFSRLDLAEGLASMNVLLPPGGPIFNALSILYKSHILAYPPAGSELDDEAFEPGALYENNELFAKLYKGHAGWTLLDVHSGLYMLGTRLPESDSWS